MNRACNELLSGSGLAHDQHRRIGLGNTIDCSEQEANGRAIAIQSEAGVD
jgi:hypothetical protein